MSTSTPTTPTNAAPGTGSATSGRSASGGARNGRTTRGNRSGHKQRGGTTTGNQPSRSRTTSFKGNTIEMNGNVFECFEEQEDHLQYAKTLEALDAYTKVKLVFAVDLAPLFATKMSAPSVTRPVAIASDADELTKMIFQEEVRAYVKRNQTLEGNLATVYSVAWGHSVLRGLGPMQRRHEGSHQDSRWFQREVGSKRLFMAPPANQIHQVAIPREHRRFCVPHGRTTTVLRVHTNTWTVG